MSFNEPENLRLGTHNLKSLPEACAQDWKEYIEADFENCMQYEFNH